MNDFYENIYEIVRMIPKGKVTTYGEIAKILGSAKSARVVGYAMNTSHKLQDVPAHRVVNRNGLLTGKNHFDYPTQMQELLESEGIVIENDKIVNFETVLWNPTKTE